jgi:hypothetical protein
MVTTEELGQSSGFIRSTGGSSLFGLDALSFA